MISILVTAYRRQNYVLDAVRSVLRTSLPRSEFEIVLIIDALAPETESALVGLGVKIVKVDVPIRGEMLATGICATKGEVIVFLEDDDLFLPEKLPVLAHHFADPSVVYVHNDFRRINEEGKPIDSNPIMPKKTFACDLPMTQKDFVRILRLGGIYTLSAISVRRSAIEERLDVLRSINFTQDYAILSLLAPSGKVVIDRSAPLNEYRIHWSSVHHPFTGLRVPDSHISMVRLSAQSLTRLAEMAPYPECKEFYRMLAESWEAALWSLTGETMNNAGVSRNRLARATAHMVFHGYKGRGMLLFAVVSCAAVSRPLAASLYGAIKRVHAFLESLPI
jgi:hypothetical protein